MTISSIQKDKKNVVIYIEDIFHRRFYMVSPLPIFECWLRNEGRLFKAKGTNMTSDGHYEIRLIDITISGYWQLDKDIILSDMKDFIRDMHLQPASGDVPVFYNKSLAISIGIIFGIIGITYYIYTLLK